MEISSDKIKGYLYLGVIGVVVLAGLWLWSVINKWKTQPGAFQDFANNHPNMAAVAASFGVTGPGGQIPDVTGTSGAAASATAQTTTYSGSQGDYDVHLAAYAKAHGYPTALSAQGTDGWPWKTYDDWVLQSAYLGNIPFPT